jgi:ankyrin repeat protein
LNTTMATSAHHAAFYGYSEVLELLSKYFDVFVMDDKGRTPLFYAALRNQLAAVTFLVSLGMIKFKIIICD